MLTNLILILLALGLLTSASVPTARAHDGGRIHYSTLYNPASVQTVWGEVLNLSKTLSGNGRDYCLMLTLRTPKEKILIITGPERYAKKQNLRFSPKEQLEVTGSRISLRGQPALIAAEIKQAGRVIRLREPSGRPAWAVGEDWHIR